MKERPILFSGPMIRAILDGRKTQTRRVVTPQPPLGYDRACWYSAPVMGWAKDPPLALEWHKVRCRYGQPADRLWVRESFSFARKYGYDAPSDGRPGVGEDERMPWPVWYRASDSGRVEGPWKPSIHMPRWASRITLEITDMRVQRLHEISEEDAMSEGVEKRGEFPNITPWTNYLAPKGSPGAVHFSIARRSFESLWNSINAKSHPWASNLWVWAVSFRMVRQ